MTLESLTDLRTPWCVHVVATLRVADRIAEGMADVGDLANAAGCDRDALHDVLCHLASKGVVAELAAGRFELTELGQQLRDESDFLDLDGIGGRMARAWSTLPSYVRTGKPGYSELFGRSFWEDVAADPVLGKSFDELMGPAGHGAPSADFELSGGWENVRAIVDVGGGTGAMLAELLRRHPMRRGLSSTCPGRSRERAARLRPPALPTGSPPPPRASSTSCPRELTCTCSGRSSMTGRPRRRSRSFGAVPTPPGLQGRSQ